MTLGNSKILADFFKAAAKERKFEVLVATTEPSTAGLELAQTLHKAKIQTNVVPDSNIFSIMSRVNKVNITLVLAGISCTYFLEFAIPKDLIGIRFPG